MSEEATGEFETAATFTGIAWGAGVAAADSRLHPESKSAKAPLKARERTNFDLEDIISDKGLSPQKLHRTAALQPCINPFGKLDETERRRMLKIICCRKLALVFQLRCAGKYQRCEKNKRPQASR